MLPSRVIDQYGIIHVLDASGFNYIPEDDPEPRYAWRWKLIWAIAITGGIGISGCLVMAWRALA